MRLFQNKSMRQSHCFYYYMGTFIKYYKISQLIHTQIIAN
jgi:hypothetical protein